MEFRHVALKDVLGRLPALVEDVRLRHPGRELTRTDALVGHWLTLECTQCHERIDGRLLVLLELVDEGHTPRGMLPPAATQEERVFREQLLSHKCPRCANHYFDLLVDESKL